MSTCGLYGFRKNGVDKLTYNHFDSYPSGLGCVVLEFICDHSDEELDQLFTNIKLVTNDTPATKEEIKFYEKEGLPNYSVSEESPTDWYCLLYHTFGDLEVLYKLGKNHEVAMIDNHQFIKNSALCEYVYIIDLDHQVVEYYVGFQHEPQENNPYGCEPNQNNYYPCRLVTTYRFDQIRSISVDTIINCMEKQEPLGGFQYRSRNRYCKNIPRQI